MKHTALVVYEQFINGDSIKTKDLVLAIEWFKTLRDNLVVLGPMFRLAFLEADRTYLALEGFLQARNSK